MPVLFWPKLIEENLILVLPIPKSAPGPPWYEYTLGPGVFNNILSS